MVHTYEVQVDILEYPEPTNSSSHMETARYEIDAESRTTAHYNAWDRARYDFPRATEYDVRVTRMLK